MKLNNNNQMPFINLSLLSIILICFALDKCVAHPHSSTDTVPSYELLKSTDQNASSPKSSSDSKTPSYVLSSEAPVAQSPTNADAPDAQSPADADAPDAQSLTLGDSSGYSSSFFGAFADILKGEDLSTTMPQQGDSSTKLDKNSKVEQICAHTQYPDICLKTIQPLLSHNVKIEITTALEVAIKACASQVKLTITKVEKHAATSLELANELADCKEKYQNALKSLQSAIRGIPDHDFGKLIITLSSVMADVSTCESKFEDMKSSSTKSKTDGLVSIMLNNCLSIASLVRH
ncbi:uncharacterized protein LOC130731503 [Lotus japonicus]|uniref:uncharacterized protein LOC130731503 n=1 Tax=Lotus japonicus TaxID=34305 RepID=UPI002587E9E0|nr:uncharacterized protein LOC130731503 [Lotus japonicus]